MFDNDKPLVSIIIPVYNGKNYLKEAIDSALRQTYENVEIIVVNDGSNDNGVTEKIALEYGDKITYYYKNNGGVSSALNYGIKHMNGEYFSWLSHDDMYLPNKIKSEMELLDSLDEKEVVVICGTKQIDCNSNDMVSINYKKYEWQNYPDGNVISWKIALKDVIDNGSYSGCALLIPRSVFYKVGLFDEKLRYCQDLFMWMNIFSYGYNLVKTDEVAVCSRVHNGQLTQTGKRLFHSDCLVMTKKITPILLKRSDKKNNFIYSYALYNAKYNNKNAVKYILIKAKKKRLFTYNQILILRFVQLYGMFRPSVRKIYYKVFRKVKTN